MSEEIRTPKGRRLVRVEVFPDGSARYENESFGCAITTERAGSANKDGFFWPDIGTRYGTRDECLVWLDARADETVAALLPPGAIIVTEERVRELLRYFSHDERRAEMRGDANEAVDEFISALRAGAKP